VDARAAALAKIDRYRGSQQAEFQVTYVPNDVAPRILTAQIQTPAGFEDSVMVQRLDGRWYLMLGRRNGQPPGPSPAATR